MLVNEACTLANCLINSLMVDGLPLPADSANLADVTATYLRRGCQEVNRKSAKDSGDSTDNQAEFRALCQSLQLFILGSKDINRIPVDFSVMLKSLRLSSAAEIMEDVKSLFNLVIKMAIACKTQCLSLVCCLMEMTVKFVSSLPLCTQVGTDYDILSLLKTVLKKDLPANFVDQTDRVAMLAIVEVFEDLIQQASAGSQSNSLMFLLSENGALMCAKKTAAKLKDFTGLVKKVSPNTFVSILHVIDHVVDLLLGKEKIELICEPLLESVILLLDLRTQLCGECHAMLRAHLLSESRARLIDFHQMEVCSQIRKLELCAVLVQNNVTGNLLYSLYCFIS